MAIILAMIVRNEAPVIRRCLDSVLPFIDKWVICDTGSTDGTQQLIEATLRDKPGRLFEYPWKDYSTNRNEALVEARVFCDRGDYIFMIDASDVLRGELPKAFGQAPGVALEHRMGTTSWWRPCLFRKQDAWCYEGVVHEQVIGGTRAVKLGSAWIECNVGETRKSDEHYARHAEQLLPSAMKGDPRSMFYLAQSYGCCGKEKLAEDWYRKRMLYKAGDPEERWNAAYRWACRTLDWNTLEALARENPSRAEPLVVMATMMYEAGQLEAACQYISIACNRREPKGMFIDMAYHSWKADSLWCLFHHELLKRRARQTINTPGAEYPGLLLEIAK